MREGDVRSRGMHANMALRGGADLRDEVAPGARLDARDAVCEEGARHQQGALDEDEQRLLRQQLRHASARHAWRPSATARTSACK